MHMGSSTGVASCRPWALQPEVNFLASDAKLSSRGKVLILRGAEEDYTYCLSPALHTIINEAKWEKCPYTTDISPTAYSLLPSSSRQSCSCFISRHVHMYSYKSGTFWLILDVLVYPIGWSISFVLPCSWIFWLQKIGNGRLLIHNVKGSSQKVLMPCSRLPSSVYLQDLRIAQRCTGWSRYLNLKSWLHALVTFMIPTQTESPLGDKEDMLLFIFHVIIASPNKLGRLCMPWGTQNLQGFILHFIYSFLLQMYDN